MIQLAMLGVQVCALAVLVWYAFETWKLRVASEEQVEALQKPCLNLITTPRDYDETILEVNGAVGGMIVGEMHGKVGLRNMGSGPALNVSYRVDSIDSPGAADCARAEGYVPNISTGESFVMALPRAHLENADCKFVVTYESLSGRRYESRMIISKLVLTNCRFGTAIKFMFPRRMAKT